MAKRKAKLVVQGGKGKRANARNVSFSISVRWSIYIINSVDKPNFRVSLPHRRSTTASLETNPLYSFVVKTLRPLIPSKHFSIHRFLTPRPKTTMPSLKKLTKELRQEIVSYLFPFPPCTTNLAFPLATLIFAKTRFCSHINFIGRCLQSKVIPKGFRSNFHASSFSCSNQYLYQIQCAQNSFPRNIISFKRDKNVGNFLVRSAFKTIEKPGTFKCARSRCKTCPFVQNADKISGPKRSVKITDRFTCTSANVIYCITSHYAKSYTLAKQEDD